MTDRGRTRRRNAKTNPVRPAEGEQLNSNQARGYRGTVGAFDVPIAGSFGGSADAMTDLGRSIDFASSNLASRAPRFDLRSMLLGAGLRNGDPVQTPESFGGQTRTGAETPRSLFS